MDKIAVLIPCYNEEKTIEKVVRDAKAALPEAVIYVYNNNSTDRTAELAEKAGAVVRQEYKQGKGNVIRRMFQEVDALCYIMVDGDDTYPMENAREMADLVLERNSDMVVGYRLSSTYFEENKRPFHNMGKLSGPCVDQCTVQIGYSGYYDGISCIFLPFCQDIPGTVRGFEIETEMTIHAVYNNMQVDNVVITYRDRPEGSESKLNTYSDGFRVLKTIFRMFRQYRPFAFFGLLSLLLFVIAVGFFIPVGIEYVETGLVPKFPTLIACGFAGLAALQSLFAGLILHNLGVKDRRDFEFRLQDCGERYERIRLVESRK